MYTLQQVNDHILSSSVILLVVLCAECAPAVTREVPFRTGPIRPKFSFSGMCELGPTRPNFPFLRIRIRNLFVLYITNK
jgi:hypothetical protein